MAARWAGCEAHFAGTLPHHYLITPIVPGRIQPLIGALYQLPAVAADFGDDGGQAYADGEHGAWYRGVVGDVHAGKGLAQLFGRQTRTIGEGIEQHHRKLFAAVTRGRSEGRRLP
jgi:hypothetical protein